MAILPDTNLISSCTALQYCLIDLRFRSHDVIRTGPGLSQLAQDLVKDYCEGRWRSILENTHVRRYVRIDETHSDTCSLSVTPLVPNEDNIAEIIIRFTVIATLLSVFVQVNFTGPVFPLEPIEWLNHWKCLDEPRLNASSLSCLSMAGEPAYHLAKSATFLFLAIKLLESICSTDSESAGDPGLIGQFFPTLSWWQLRAGILHRKLIEEQIPFSDTLMDELSQLSSHLSKQNDCGWPILEGGDLRDLLPMLTLERGLAEHLVGNEKNANKLFLRAAEEAGLEYELTGILGKRTKFQENELSQLVVLARGRERAPTKSCELHSPTPSSSSTTPGSISAAPITLALNDDTLLEKTHFTSTCAPTSLAIDPHNQPTLHPIDQSILLALSLSIKNTSPSHGLTKAQISPFIERVLENVSNWSVHSMALLIRSRLEAHRSRTVERGLLQHQALVDQLTKDAENDPVDRSTAKERVRWTWGLDLPSKWELERELGRKLVGLGVIRSAMEIFERLEMWEDVVQCHISLDSKPTGIQLVKDLIAGQKVESDVTMSKFRTTQDAKRLGKLWCLLGELESNPAHWQTAWDVSQKTSSRAMRSLGAYHFSKGSYQQSQECLSVALSINPLFVKTWFICGCAAMRLGDWVGAESAFRRCISLDDEDAEAWNNLATVYLKQAVAEEHLTASVTLTKTTTSCSNIPDDPTSDEVETLDEDQVGETEPRTVFSHPMAAFYALQQAVKLSYDSWRMWTNYMIVAISVAEHTEAIRALGRVLEIRGHEGLDHAALQKLMEAAILSKKLSAGETSATSRIFDRLQDVMNRIVLLKCANDYIVWESASQLCLCVDDYKTALEHQLTAYRVGVSQATELWTTQLESWISASEIVQRTLERLQSLGPKLSAEQQSVLNWKWQSKSILRSFLSKSKSSFEDEAKWGELNERLKIVKEL